MESLSADSQSIIARHPLTADEQSTDTDTVAEMLLSSQMDLKAEKRVSYAYILLMPTYY